MTEPSRGRLGRCWRNSLPSTRKFGQPSTRWGSTSARSASIVSSLLIARSARLGATSATWTWPAEPRCFCWRTSNGKLSLALIDWQLTTAARPVIDLADFLVSHLDISERRRHEDRLLQIYHSLLTERGVAGYRLEQCKDDYRMALLLPASRLATAVAIHPGLTATPEGFWNVVFPRYARALADLGVTGLLQQRYG
jgi:Protein of unknown function (DUF1679)